jgi:hypothetical protein
LLGAFNHPQPLIDTFVLSRLTPTDEDLSFTDD